MKVSRLFENILIYLEKMLLLGTFFSVKTILDIRNDCFMEKLPGPI